MAGNNFRIPTWTPELVNWNNAVHARNDANAKQRAEDWQKVYDTAGALGMRIRQEKEAEKARQEAAKEAEIQRAFQAAEAEKAREFQAAENAKNRGEQAAARQAQQTQNANLLEIENKKNLAKANSEVDVLNAELARELGKTQNPADQALTRKLYDSKINNVYARYGLDRPQLEEVPAAPITPENPQVAEVPTVSQELTNAQIQEQTKQLSEQMKNDRQTISTLPNGPKKAKLMQEYNEQHKDDFGSTGVAAYTADEIKKAGIVPIKRPSSGTVISPNDPNFDLFRKNGWIGRTRGSGWVAL